MELDPIDGWNVKEDRQPAKCLLDKKLLFVDTGTWELGVRLPDELIRYGSLIFKGTPDGVLTCSILTPTQRLHRGY